MEAGAARRPGLSLRTQGHGVWTKAETVVLGGMGMGIDCGGEGEGHGKDKEERLSTPGSGQDRAEQHGQGDRWLTRKVLSRQPNPGPRAQKEGLSQQWRRTASKSLLLLSVHGDRDTCLLERGW